MLLTQHHWRLASAAPSIYRRAISTLPNNPHIVSNHENISSRNTANHDKQYVHAQSPTTHTLSYLPTSPPNGSLAIGTTSKIPPTPDSLKENHNFLRILHSVIKEHATKDPDVIAQAGAYASTAGSSLGSGGVFFPQQQKSKKRKVGGGGGGTGGDGAGGASSQGGAGGAGRGGYIHVSDLRSPPDYGRIAWPEDIFGSLEVDGEGNFVGENGGYQESGTYRVVTREGM